MLKWNDILRSAQITVRKHGAEILTGVGVAGMITTVIMAVRATPKALILLEKKKKEREVEKLGVAETAKTVWKCYIPTGVTGALSIACVIGANSVNMRRNAALAAAYTLSESALKEYQEKVVETIGEKKEQSVKDAIAKDKIDDHPVSRQEIILTEKGNTLCYDVLSGRYFKSDIGKIQKAENELNRRMRNEMFVSLNDFYYEIGLSDTQLGNLLGWNIEKGSLNLEFSSQLTEDGTPCLVIGYSLAPEYDYER